MDQRVAIEGYRIQGEDVAFRSFNVGPAKGLRRAAGDNVPMLMVITDLTVQENPRCCTNSIHSGSRSPNRELMSSTWARTVRGEKQL
jgi:hypothetical protein